MAPLEHVWDTLEAFKKKFWSFSRGGPFNFFFEKIDNHVHNI